VNKTITLASSIGVVFALALFFAAFPSSIDVQAQTEPIPYPSREKTISVTGYATAKVNPDLLTIQFGVEAQEKTAKEALDANSALMTQVIDSIKKAGVTDKEISTAQLTIYPVYESYQENGTGIYKQRLTGYSVSNIIRVETKNLSLASAIIDSGVAAGANRVDSVSFGLSPAKQTQTSDDLLGDAVENARLKADKTIAPLNYKVIGVKYVSLSEFDMRPPPVVYGAYSREAASVSTPIFSSDQQVTTSVNIVFIIGSE